MIRWIRLVALSALAALAGCAGWFAPPPGIGREVAFADLPGWADDRHSEAWTALLRGCDRLGGRDPAWEQVCRQARQLPEPDDARARAFFEQQFRVFRVDGEGGRDGLITGYYEPLLNGSRSRSERFRIPLHARPDDLLTIDLGSLYPELKGRPLRGRLSGNRVVPYYSRSEITDGSDLLAGKELLWVDDPVEAFLLQVQGSGRVRLPDGSELAVGYADQNGHPYRSLGSRLIELGALTREEVTLPRILEWIAAHPAETEQLLNSNPSYIFFQLRDARLDGPIGSLGVALTAQRSIAVDPAYIPLGLPVWVDTELPDGSRFRRLAFAQDTGGAIKGAVRADLFVGRGVEAGQIAGAMRQVGRLHVLRPRAPQPVTAVSQR